MESYMHLQMHGYVKKQYLYDTLRDSLKAINAEVLDSGEGAAYQIGHHFGQIETLKAIIDLLKSMPEEERPKEQPPKVWHRS